METVSLDTQIPVPTSPVVSFNQLHEQWVAFDKQTQRSIQRIADIAVNGLENWNGTRADLMLTENGATRPKTLPEIAKHIGERFPENVVWIHHAKALVERYTLAKRKGRLDAFLADIGPRHANSRLENYIATIQEQRDVLAAFNGYCDSIAERVKAGVGIVANGRVGTGKTHLLIGAARRAIQEGFTVSYRNGQSLISAFRDRIQDDDGTTEGDLLDSLAEPDILILDDPVPPHGELTGYQKQIFYIFSDRRYNEMKPTWVSMNVASGDEAEKRIGAAIVDRWKDGSLTLAFNWPSYRKVQQQ